MFQQFDLQNFSHISFREKIKKIFLMCYGNRAFDFINMFFDDDEDRSDYTFELGFSDILFLPPILDYITHSVIMKFGHMAQGKSNSSSGLIGIIFGLFLMSPFIAVSTILKSSISGMCTMIALPIIGIVHLALQGNREESSRLSYRQSTSEITEQLMVTQKPLENNNNPKFEISANSLWKFRQDLYAESTHQPNLVNLK